MEDGTPAVAPRAKKARAEAKAPKRKDAPASDNAIALVKAERAKPAQRRGRKPRVAYSEQVEQKILEKLRNGETLTAICEATDMPRASLVRQWAAEDEAFGKKYQRARELGCHAMADEIIKLADNEATDPGKVARDRLRVDSRKWLLSKVFPAVFGERVEVAAKAGIVVVKLDAEDLAL
jgi:hypothetical protein